MKKVKQLKVNKNGVDIYLPIGVNAMNIDTDPMHRLVTDEQIAKWNSSGSGGGGGGSNVGQTTAKGGEIFNDYSHNTAFAQYAHAEGFGTGASGIGAHTEGIKTYAIDEGAHAEGEESHAEGKYSHAEGSGTYAFGPCTHAEGLGTDATGKNAHAEGRLSKASGQEAHAEGQETEASGDDSHAEGWRTHATYYRAHAEGAYTIADSQESHAEGFGTVARSPRQHVQGRYNIEDNQSKYAHIVGNGTEDVKANAHTLDWDGNAWYQGKIKIGGTSYNDADEVALKKDIPPAQAEVNIDEIVQKVLAQIRDSEGVKF